MIQKPGVSRGMAKWLPGLKEDNAFRIPLYSFLVCVLDFFVPYVWFFVYIEFWNCLLVSENIRLNIGEKSTKVWRQVVFNKSLSDIKSFSELEQAIMLFRDWIFSVEDLKFGNNLKKIKFHFCSKEALWLFLFLCDGLLEELSWKNNSCFQLLFGSDVFVI